LGTSVEEIIKANESYIKKKAPKQAARIQHLHAAEAIKGFVKKDLPAVSWNHGKLVGSAPFY
jgi:hypothetical protein